MTEEIKGLPYNPYAVAFLNAQFRRRGYILIFTDTVEQIMALSNSAKNLYLYTAKVLNSGGNITDIVHISPMDYSRTCSDLGIKYSRSSFFKARKELIAAKLIYPAMTQTAYYVNPEIIFAGKRKELVAKYEADAKQNIELYTKIKEAIDEGKEQ